jgi:hypothetical protein
LKHPGVAGVLLIDMTDQTPPSNRLPLPLAFFMVFTCAVWCGLWIIVAHVARWKLQWLYQYRDYVWEAAVVFITMGAGIMYLAVDQVGRGLRDLWQESLRRQVEQENIDSAAGSDTSNIGLRN